MSKANYMLTTVDNPYNPYDQFDEWYQFDLDRGYDTCGYLARIANTSDQFTDQENAEELNRAIDEIIKYDFRNIYRRVKEKEAV